MKSLLLLIPLTLLALSVPAIAAPENAAAPPNTSPADPTDDDYLRSRGTQMPVGPVSLTPEPQGLRPGRREVMFTTYLAGYAASARIATRLGLDGEYKIMRLESAYMYDVFGHIFITHQLGLGLGSLNRWAGMEEKQSRRIGAWAGAFGMQTFAEILNGFMPSARLDPMDIVSNAIGAWWADGGQELRRRSPTFRRISLQYGAKSWRRMIYGRESSAALGNYWHDYPNGRWGVGFDIGPLSRKWATLFATYEITSMQASELKNRFGLGVELPVFVWFDPLIRMVPGGASFLSVFNWFDDRLLMPFLYVQLYHYDAPAFSNRNPFEE